MALDLSHRRIDAVGISHNRIDIIEITPVIDFRALGQCQTYPLLYKEKFAPTAPIHTVLVAETIATDIECAITHSQLHCELFTAAGSHVSLFKPTFW